MRWHRALFFWEGYFWSAAAVPPLLRVMVVAKINFVGSACAVKREQSSCTPKLARRGAGDSLLQQALQLFGIAGGREAGVAGTHQGAGFVFGKVGQRLAQGEG